MYIELHKLQRPLNLQYIAFHIRGQIIIEIPEHTYLRLDMNITNWFARIIIVFPYLEPSR